MKFENLMVYTHSLKPSEREGYTGLDSQHGKYAVRSSLSFSLPFVYFYLFLFSIHYTAVFLYLILPLFAYVVIYTYIHSLLIISISLAVYSFRLFFRSLFLII